jgi:hypothetical protein
LEKEAARIRHSVVRTGAHSRLRHCHAENAVNAEMVSRRLHVGLYPILQVDLSSAFPAFSAFSAFSA